MADGSSLPEQSNVDLTGHTFAIPADEEGLIAASTVLGGTATPRSAPNALPEASAPEPVLAPVRVPASSPATPDMQHAPGSLVSLVMGAGLDRSWAVAFAETIGVDLDEVDSNLLGCLLPADAVEAVAGLHANGVRASMGQRAKFMQLIKRAVAGVNAAVAQASVPVHTAPASRPPAFSIGGEDYRFSDFLDQTMPGTFKLRPADEIAKLRRLYCNVTGGEPSDAARPTAEQICALLFRLESGRSLYVDFAVWTPWNGRIQKQHRFTAQVFVNGTLQSQQLRGPSSFTGWLASWVVFRSAVIMTGRVVPADVDAYSEGIRELTELFPEAWGLIHQADEVMRSELWARVHEEMLVQPIAGVSIANPWGWVLRATAFGSENVRFQNYWQKRVMWPLMNSNAGAAAKKAFELERAPIDVFALAGGASSSSTPFVPRVPPVPRPVPDPHAAGGGGKATKKQKKNKKAKKNKREESADSNDGFKRGRRGGRGGAQGAGHTN